MNRLCALVLSSWVVVLGLGCSSGPNVDRKEICNNGIDDDGNNLIDCADPACAGMAGCGSGGGAGNDSGYYGTCMHCGQSCNNQTTCVANGYLTDQPIPLCEGAHCQQLSSPIDLSADIKLSAWTGIADNIHTVAIRSISTTGIDGSAVSCDTVKAIAIGKTAADAAQIETSGHFNLYGMDVIKVMVGGGDTGVTDPYYPTSVSSNYLLWVEFWGGIPDSSTHLPTGNRLGWGCFDATNAPDAVAPVLVNQDCSPTRNDGGSSCRQFSVTMPGPQ